jgi:hypothetical protein
MDDFFIGLPFLKGTLYSKSSLKIFFHIIAFVPCPLLSLGRAALPRRARAARRSPRRGRDGVGRRSPRRVRSTNPAPRTPLEAVPELCPHQRGNGGAVAVDTEEVILPRQSLPVRPSSRLGLGFGEWRRRVRRRWGRRRGPRGTGDARAAATGEVGGHRGGGARAGSATS